MENTYLHFNSYEKVLINENHNIPTLVYHDKQKTLVGHEALNNIKNLELINSNFKIDIGKYDSKNFSKDFKIHQTADGVKVSALKLANLFFDSILKRAENFLKDNFSTYPKSVIIAEPLVLQQNNDIDNKWLSLYRKNIKMYFEKNKFENISFLPEPFAVFQYYKYCKKFEPLNKGEQILVLVIDFGGGTFDTCLIETSESGNIREGGKNSKPLGSSSIAKGGNDLDIAILNSIILKHNAKETAKIKKGYRLVRDVKKGKVKQSSLTDEQSNFYKNYQNALVKIQKKKEQLVNNIRQWSNEKEPTDSISLTLPRNFFDIKSNKIDYQFTAIQLREIFKQFYQEHLKKGLELTLSRGLINTKKKKPDYILLSGGSSKIAWLNLLMCEDFSSAISDANIVKLENYKEVVSAGLAIECARKFYNDTGDFADITYNAINLVLNPNDKGYEFPKYKSQSKNLIYSPQEGLLIPTSTNLRKLYNSKLKWRFKLKTEPKNYLYYYFLRNSKAPEEIDNLINIINQKAIIKTKKFDKYLEIELELREDGTAMPKVKINSTKEEIHYAKLTPFFIDMTYSAAAIRNDSYLGIDFGSCNSSISFISHNHIEKYNSNIKETENKQLENILTNSPLPISYIAAKFYNEYDELLKATRFRQLFENSLALLYYIILTELNVHNPQINLSTKKIKLIRTSGSLLLGFKWALSKITDTMFFSIKIKNIFTKEILSSFDHAVNFINNTKHSGTTDYDFDFNKVLKPLYIAIEKISEDSVFGYFNRMRNKPFEEKIIGEIICAHGNGIFTDKFVYEGDKYIPKQYAYLINKVDNYALNLFPLIHWDICSIHKDEDYGHCYFFDKFNGRNLIFSSVTGNCRKELKENDEAYPKFKDKLDEFFNTSSSCKKESIILKN